MFALGGFLSPWLLLWGLAAAIPIAMHLLSRSRSRPRNWAAMQLLESVVQQSARRIRVEQLILLAIRVAIPLTLALAIARPYLNSLAEQMSATTRDARLNVLILDTSYSMAYRPGAVDAQELSLLDRAKDAAEKIILDAPAGDAFAVVVQGSPPVAGPVTFDPRAAADAVQKATLSYSGVDVPGALALAKRVIAERNQTILPGKPRVWLLSDFGRDGWRDTQANLIAWNQLSQVANVSRQAFLPDSRENWAITQLQIPQSQALGGPDQRVLAWVTRFGDAQGVSDATISLVVDGVAVNSQSLRLACGQKKPLVIPLSIREPGQHVVQVKLSPDSLSVDDSRTAVLTVKEKLSVLLVGQSEQKTAAFRIALGIAPEVFSVTSGTLSSIVQGGTRALNAFDVVVLCNLPAITPAAVSLLERFTRDGGGLAVLHGSAADEYAWNSNAERLLDYRLDIASPFGDYSIDPQEYSSPLSEAFREFPDAGLVTTPIFRYWKISQSDPSGAGRAVLLRTSAGDPLVLQGENGAGRVISMFSCPELGTATDAWNAVAAWPSFVPVFHALVRQAAPGDRAANLNIGDTLLWNLPLEQSRVPVIIQRPDSTQDTALAAANSAESGSSELVYAKINLPGVYTAKIAANPTASAAVEGRVSATDAPVQYFAAQFTSSESDLATVPLDQLPTEDVSVDDSAEGDFGAGATDRNDFGVSLIWVVAALMICESILAWFFGSRLR